MLIPQFSRKHESNDGKLECPGQKRKNDKVCTELSRLFLVCLEEIKVFFFWVEQITFFSLFAWSTLFSMRGLFVREEFTASPRSDVYLTSSHLPAPIVPSCVPLPSRVSLCILLLLLISSPMTRLTEEAGCAVFPINTQAYFWAVVCAARSPPAPHSVSCTRVNPARRVV